MGYAAGYKRLKKNNNNNNNNEDFHNSAAPGDDLIRSIERGSQRRCNYYASQKYMRACVKFLILKHIFLHGLARWAQSETQHGYPKLVRVII